MQAYRNKKASAEVDAFFHQDFFLIRPQWVFFRKFKGIGPLL